MSRPASPAKSARLADLVLVNQALAYHHAAETAARQAAGYAALCGLTLKALKKQAGHGEWLTYHADRFGDRLPERTARYYMAVAEGLKVKTKDLPALETLLKVPAHKLPAAKRERLAAMVRNLCDGETMASLIEAYRITKRPPKAPAGGYHPDRTLLPAWAGEQGIAPETDYAALPPDQQATYRQWESDRQAERTLSPEQTAFDFYAPLLRDLAGDHHGPRRWMHLPDAQRAELRDTLRAMLTDLETTFPAQS